MVSDLPTSFFHRQRSIKHHKSPTLLTHFHSPGLQRLSRNGGPFGPFPSALRSLTVCPPSTPTDPYLYRRSRSHAFGYPRFCSCSLALHTLTARLVASAEHYDRHIANLADSHKLHGPGCTSLVDWYGIVVIKPNYLPPDHVHHL